MALVEGVQQAPHHPAARRRTPVRFLVAHRPAVLTSLVVLLISTLLGWGVHWWTRPDIFGDMGGAVSMPGSPLVDSQWTVGELSEPPAKPVTLTFRGAPTPRLATNTADATFRFSLCTPIPRRPAIASVDGDGSRYCAALTLITRGTVLTWREGGPYVVVTITPHRAGRVHLTGVTYRYSLGRDHQWRRGDDFSGLDIRQTVLPHRPATSGSGPGLEPY